MILIDGKAVSEKIREQIRREHEILSKEIGRKAGLAVILAGEDPASKIYVKNNRGPRSNLHQDTKSVSPHGKPGIIQRFHRPNRGEESVSSHFHLRD